ncbi:cation diffusion facilitator family transporter [Kocuria rosea]|uniref:cation diffusion facilitator family transporter n=1 Tax=Kocuria rosea TaxID=1275 RepID=UPI00203AEDC1|nr:cation diffusion facilitator family transporter [Kocuria rosea]MCM3686491.1 cation diffusion facilitator family transporter [Kocuria rosea]
MAHDHARAHGHAGHDTDRGHDHGPGHAHAGPGTDRWRIVTAFGITAGLFVVQLAGALWTGSLALLFDTAHVLTDAGGLLLALIAAQLSLRPPTARRTWGWRRAEIVAAALQAGVLLAVGLFVLVEGVRRFVQPEPVASVEMIVFGVLGLAGNLVAMAVLVGGRRSNLNLRAAVLEVLNDALGSVAVIVAAVVITLTGWVQADAVVALLIGVLIVPRTIRLLVESLSVLMESAPPGLDLADVRGHILELPHVVEVHDLHASRISSDLPVLTAHVVLEDEYFYSGGSAEALGRIQRCVAEHFPVSVQHSTIQLEPADHVEPEVCAPHDH